MKRLLLAALTCCAAAAPTAYAQTPSADAGPETLRAAGREKPAVAAREQPGSPLQVSSSRVKWATPDQRIVELYYVVQNTSKRPVRAFAVRAGDATRGQATDDGCFFHNAPVPGKIIQPGGTVGRSLWQQSPTESGARISLTIDYVEFADGGAWGEDSCQAAEMFDGMRAGAAALRENLRRVLREEGPDTLLNTLKSDYGEVEPPQGRSAVWVKGFRSGAGGMRERVRRANEEGGLPEVEAALRRAVEGSERN